MNPSNLIDLKRLASSKLLTKRELFSLVALHALLSIPPEQRPSGVTQAAVLAADKLLEIGRAHV